MIWLMKWKWSQSIIFGIYESRFLFYIRCAILYHHLNLFILVVLKTLFEGLLVDGMSLQKWWLVVNQRKAKIYQISWETTWVAKCRLVVETKIDPICESWFGLNRFKWCFGIVGICESRSLFVIRKWSFYILYSG